MTATAEPTLTEIKIPFPDAPALHLQFRVGGCRFDLKPGDGEAWVSGTYTDPTDRIKPLIGQAGGTVTVSQAWGVRQVTDLAGLFGKMPRFALEVSRAKPFQLGWEGGAGENHLDLGGVPLDRLEVRTGAGKTSLDFSAPNPNPMERLSLSCGAASLEAHHLANANSAEIVIDGGAAACRFDFDGQLSRDARVKITSGVSAVEIRIPATTAATVTSESFLGGLDVGDGFTKKDGAYWNEAALAGKTPRLSIHASVNLGALHLRAT